MEDKGIIKISDENISITYKAPTEKETFRTAMFKKIYLIYMILM